MAYLEADRWELCNTADELRDIFNRNFAGRIASQDLILHERSRKPARNANLPRGTQTVMYNVLDRNGAHVAVVHVYEDGNGDRLGMLDPKSLVIGRTVYYWRPPDHPYRGALFDV